MLKAIETRLKTLKDEHGRPLFNQVKSAAALANLRDKPIRGHRTAFVVPLSDRPGRNQREVGEALQEQTRQVGVVLVIRELDNAVLEELRDKVRDALFGWQPLTEYDHFMLGNGDLHAMTGGQLWWMDRFITSRFLEAKHG